MSYELIGLILTAIGLFYAGFQINASKKIARGEFLLRLDEMFKQHNEVHVSLRPKGKWADKKTGPKSDSSEDWAAVEQYMGLFERINILVEDKIVSIEIIDRLYGYRVTNILNNDIIRREKIESEAESWRNFIKLQEKLEKNRRDRSTWWYKTCRFFRLI